ncbi:MAG: magnesium transporter [Albidovulum sp.]|nr:magnesium transporter [Albidovulum sp.]MDE0304552.1 magnesium transporter [Albidovulum sp.]MDE0531460.1 magnesium transporter [Albidovulum sp.]
MVTSFNGNQEVSYSIDSELVESILEAVRQGRRNELVQLLEPLHPADIADVLEQIGSAERADLVNLWGVGFDSGVLPELDDNIAVEVVDSLPSEQLSDAVRDLESDQVVDLVEDLEPGRQEEVLNTLDEAGRAAVEKLLNYPEDSAGRLMQREFVMLPLHWTVGEAIDFLRSSNDPPDGFYHVMLVDSHIKPVGQVALGRLMSSKREVELKNISESGFMTFSAAQSQEDVAYAFKQYRLVSAPVVDETGRLIGAVTIDDAVDVLDEHATEDMHLLAGVGDESLSDHVLEIAKQRFPWLIANLATAVLASAVIAQFSATIEAVVALAVLMPIVVSMGGNAGTQSLTVAVRAIATKDLTGSNAWRVIRRESVVGLINGVVFAMIIGSVGLVWYESTTLSVVLAAAVVVTMLMAGISGILVPILLERARVDPALASGAFVTTVTDVVGFFAFLGLAYKVFLS